MISVEQRDDIETKVSLQPYNIHICAMEYLVASASFGLGKQADGVPLVCEDRQTLHLVLVVLPATASAYR